MMDSSCLMLSTSLWTGIDFSAVFKDEDLIDTGIERDSHITVFYSPDKIVPREGLLSNIETLLGEEEYKKLTKELKDNEPMRILDFFELGKFENDKDYLVLKLQPENFLYDSLKILNTGLTSAYEIKSTFNEYVPHMTLAMLQPGKAKNYMFSSTLGLILETATFSIDDFVLSYGEEKKYQITTYNAVTRYFRQKEQERDREYYENM